MDRVIFQVTPDIRAHLDRIQKQGRSIAWYMRSLVLADMKKGKKHGTS